MARRPPLNPNWTREAMQRGMDQAERAADPDWWRFMFLALVEIATKQEFLFTDDLEQLRRERGGPETHEQRAIGPLMKSAADAGLIESTNRLIAGRWDKRVWRSRIYGLHIPRPPPVQPSLTL